MSKEVYCPISSFHCTNGVVAPLTPKCVFWVEEDCMLRMYFLDKLFPQILVTKADERVVVDSHKHSWSPINIYINRIPGLGRAKVYYCTTCKQLKLDNEEKKDGVQ